tara:strand:- start:1831 stop:2613 length:783 start_codon:yes stop_codon:yes gene_type:complete
MRVIGQNQGFNFEKKIQKDIHNKKICDLSPFYKPLINKMFGYEINNSSIVKCIKKEGIKLEKKNDLTFEIGGQRINTSLKHGNQNSIHQEALSTFISFLDNIKKLSKYEINLINKFHWCDGTLDNTGPIKDRVNKTKFKNMFPIEYQKYMETLRTYKEEIFFRVWVGSKNKPQYLIHVDNINSKPSLINFDKILYQHLNMTESNGSIGLLTFQNCWACLKGQDHGHPSHKCDASCPKKIGKKHRLDIQFKSKDIGEFIIE